VKILFFDIVQLSNAPAALKSPALADRWNGNSTVIQLDTPRLITAVGIGYTEASTFSLSFNLVQPVTIEGNSGEIIYDGGTAYTGYGLDIESNVINEPGSGQQTVSFTGNGLYLIKPVTASRVTVTADGAYTGRFAAGIAVDLPTAIAKEPGWAGTASARKTLSGQIIEGAGGYSYRTVSLDVRYKIGREAAGQIEAAYDRQIGRGFPYFLLFDTEANRLPFLRLYARDAKKDYVFQGGINRFLFSRKFEFEECF
jgi:hypothetical protein